MAPADRNGCELWTAGTFGDTRYGQFWAEGRGWGAHVWAYRHFVGPIPEGLEVRHTCDNKLCVALAHLRVGTHAENIADKVDRDRQAKGERHGRAKLAEADIREIRERFLNGMHPVAGTGRSRHELAREFGVSNMEIWRIATRRSWRHI